MSRTCDIDDRRAGGIGQRRAGGIGQRRAGGIGQRRAGGIGRLRPSPGEPAIELGAVTRVYPGRPPVAALRGLDLRVGGGELVGVVGPSGSGKTTLLQIMGTLDRPTSGLVKVAGRDTAHLGDRRLAALRARRIGFVFQQFFLAEHQTLLENVADGLLYAGVRPAERKRLAARALERVGLGGRAASRANQLSGGQRQRVAIARAIAGQPAIILADEPTGNLDSKTGASILALLESLHGLGATIVVITHNLDIAARLPRRVEMRDGRIVGDSGAPAPALGGWR